MVDSTIITLTTIICITIVINKIIGIIKAKYDMENAKAQEAMYKTMREVRYRPNRPPER